MHFSTAISSWSSMTGVAGQALNYPPRTCRPRCNCPKERAGTSCLSCSNNYQVATVVGKLYLHHFQHTIVHLKVTRVRLKWYQVFPTTVNDQELIAVELPVADLETNYLSQWKSLHTRPDNCIIVLSTPLHTHSLSCKPHLATGNLILVGCFLTGLNSIPSPPLWK